MAMGQQKDRQGDLMVSWSEMPRSPGHVFYDRLQLVGVALLGFPVATGVPAVGDAGTGAGPFLAVTDPRAPAP